MIILFLKICCLFAEPSWEYSTPPYNCSEVISDYFYNTRVCVFSNVAIHNLSNVLIDTHFEGEFIHPGLFKTVKFVDSSVPEVPNDIFRKFFNVERIYLNASEVHDISDESFVFAFSLREVYLDHNQIESLADGAFSPAKQVGLIDLSYNLLETINPDAFMQLVQLRRLYLSHNRLLNVPVHTFENIPSLSVIKLNNNLLEYVDRSLFWHNILIEAIDLSHNKLIELRLSFTGDRLHVLDAHNNNIQRFFIRSELETINVSVNLSSNKLIEFRAPENIEITVLNVEMNRLGRSLAEVQNITSMSSLRELYIGHNSLAPLDSEIFTELGNLKYLGIPNVDLNELREDVFAPLHSLTVLDISYNPSLRTIQLSNLTKLYKLRSLYVNGDNINGMDLHNIKSTLPEVFELQMSDTSWHCADLEDAIAQMRNKSVYIVANPGRYVRRSRNVNGITCHGPFKNGSFGVFDEDFDRKTVDKKHNDNWDFRWVILAGSVVAGIIGIYVLIKIILCITQTDERDRFTEVAYLSD